jgi:hypothetical protein
VAGFLCRRQPARRRRARRSGNINLVASFSEGMSWMFFLLTGLCALPATAPAAEFVLAAPGIPPPPVVIAEDAPFYTREAAEMLVDGIERVTGQRPRLMRGQPPAVPERAIWVGPQPGLDGLFPNLDFDFQQPEEILLACAGGHVVIAGRDRWDPARPTAPTNSGKTVQRQFEYGTANAVFTFMQDQLGVRWLWPGELGEDYPRRETLALAEFEHRYHPPVRSRTGMMHFSALNKDRSYGKSHLWMRAQRLQLDSMQIESGHSFVDWWDRHFKTHPEMFALQPDGTRGTYPNPRTMKLCMSNPKVIELWLEDVESALERDATKWVFSASPNDGWSSGHCVCESCRAWDHPDGEPRLFHWKGHNEVLPALTDRDVTFANRCAAALKERHPGKDYRVLMISYGHSRPAPVGVRPADNVIMSIVANFFGRANLVDRGSTRGDSYRRQFEAWAELKTPFLWRPNTGSPAGWQQGLPDLHIRQTMQDFKDIAAAGCQGIFIDSVWEHWATQGPQYYVMAQLLWNPEQDGEALLGEFYQRAFGPAADSVAKYFDLWEKARAEFVDRHGEAGVFQFPKMYTPERLREAARLLDAAAQAAAVSELLSRRVAMVRAGLDYTELCMDTIGLMRGYWLKKDPEVAARALKNWERVEALATGQDSGINWGPVRPSTERMAGLHPDHPPSKTSLRLLRDLDKD